MASLAALVCEGESLAPLVAAPLLVATLFAEQSGHDAGAFENRLRGCV